MPVPEFDRTMGLLITGPFTQGQMNEVTSLLRQIEKRQPIRMFAITVLDPMDTRTGAVAVQHMATLFPKAPQAEIDNTVRSLAPEGLHGFDPLKHRVNNVPRSLKEDRR